MKHEKMLLLKKNLITHLIEEREEKLNAAWIEEETPLRDTMRNDTEQQIVQEKDFDSRERETELHSKTLDDLAVELDTLKKTPKGRHTEYAVFGALVKTDKIIFMIAVDFPVIAFEGHQIRGIATSSHIFEKMEGLREGRKFYVENDDYTILEII